MSGRDDLLRGVSAARSVQDLLGGNALDTYRRDLVRAQPGISAAARIAGMQLPTIRPDTIAAAQQAQRIALGLAGPYGGLEQMQRRLREQSLHTGRTIDQLGAAGMLDILRERNWGTKLAGIEKATIADLMPNAARHAAELGLAWERAMAGVGPHAARSVADPVGDYAAKIREQLDRTSLKMSVLAGFGDVAGVRSAAYVDTVRDLLGDWRTRPDLPASFWRDRRVRERHYRRAEVDPGLVEAPAPAVVEVMVSSGLAAGGPDKGGTTALLTFGGVTLSIRTGQAAVDAYSCVVAFETSLRAFVAAKLEAAEGPNWFKRRVDGAVLKKAKQIREAALKSGEAAGPLVDYTELGELKDTIKRSDKWDQVFEAVFVNRDAFEQSMLTLMALRRPVAHSRSIDGPRLVEAMLVMARLDAQMTDDGAWRLAAAADS